jgi:hypothetical protein
MGFSRISREVSKENEVRELTGIHAFGADGYVCMGQQVVNPHTLFFSLPYIQ